MALSIPITLGMTFGMMYVLGIDLQQVSIASLIIAMSRLGDARLSPAMRSNATWPPAVRPSVFLPFALCLPLCLVPSASREPRAGTSGERQLCGSVTRVDEITVGTLAIDVVDAANRTIVWRGMASHDLDLKASPAKREKNIDKAAEKLFKNFPPKV